MPTIIEINSVKVYMYFEDDNPPHFHVIDGETQAKVEIATMQVLEGKLTRRAKKHVMPWAIKNKKLLNDKWKEFS
jgi:hypothetical protein